MRVLEVLTTDIGRLPAVFAAWRRDNKAVECWTCQIRKLVTFSYETPPCLVLPWFHKWNKWKTLKAGFYQGFSVRLNERIYQGSFVEQVRMCQECDRLETRTISTKMRNN